jgi:hypothetical protein
MLIIPVPFEFIPSITFWISRNRRFCFFFPVHIVLLVSSEWRVLVPCILQYFLYVKSLAQRFSYFRCSSSITFLVLRFSHSIWLPLPVTFLQILSFHCFLLFALWPLPTLSIWFIVDWFLWLCSPLLSFLTDHHAMKSYWGNGGALHSFLTSTLGGSDWSASRPGRIIPRERALGTHWIGGSVGITAGLDAVVKRKIPSPCRDSNPQSSRPQPSAVPLSYPSSSPLLSSYQENVFFFFIFFLSPEQFGFHSIVSLCSFPGGTAAGSWSWPLTSI